MKTKLIRLIVALSVLALPAVVQAQNAYSTNADGSIYTYSTNADGSANIVTYAGPPWVVTIPTNINGLTVTSIGTNAFENDTSLTSVTIPDSVTNIGAEAFVEDYSLTAITVDTNNPAFSSLNGVLFDKSQTTLIEYPGGLGGSYTIPDSVTNIGADAFLQCSSLTGVTIPDSVTSIGDNAFQGAALTSVTIPASVTNIGVEPFRACPMTAITVDTNNPAFSSLNGVLFDKSQTTLIEYPGGLLGGSYTIPNSVTSIGSWAFANAYANLTSVTIPDSVTSIGADAFLFTRLTNATIGNGVTSIGAFAFAFTSLTSITIPNSVTSIGADAFVYDYSLTTVIIGNGVTSIGAFAFAFTSLTSITIPNSVTSIGADAFVYDYSLTTVIIGNGVTSIGDDAFDVEDDYSLTSVYFMGNAPAVHSSFRGDDHATAYYLPGTTGWSRQFSSELGLPIAPWFLPNPQILTHSAGFGVQPGGFGFTISWATNVSVVVQAATNLANPVWIPVSTNTLTNGTSYFSDPQWTNYPERFYRVTSAFTVGGTLTGLPAGDTVTLQDNGSDNLTLSTNGTFTFPTALPNGYAYSVTVGGTEGNTEAPFTPMNGSGTISGANVTNVAVQCMPIITGNPDVDMYNAAVADGTANGGVPGVMLTENGGPFRVTAVGPYSSDVCSTYYPWSKFINIEGTTSCSSTILPKGPAIQFGTALVCGQNFGYGY